MLVAVLLYVVFTMELVVAVVDIDVVGSICVVTIVVIIRSVVITMFNIAVYDMVCIVCWCDYCCCG